MAQGLFYKTRLKSDYYHSKQKRSIIYITERFFWLLKFFLQIILRQYFHQLMFLAHPFHASR